jgi:hypothetical protein
MQRESISIGIRSQREAPRVRFERSDAIAPGTIVIVVVRGEVIVRCTSSAAVEAMAFGGGGPTPSVMALRDAGVELSVRTGDCVCEGDAEGEPEVALDRTPVEARVVTHHEVRENLATTARAPAGLVVREAEWQPAPEREAADRDSSGDGPTRMQLLSDVFPEAAPAPPAAADPAKAAVATDARRRRLRRIALGAMLVCSFSIAMRAIRTHRLRVARAAAAQVHPAAPDSPGQASPGGSALAAPEAPLARRALAPLVDPAGARSAAGATKARRAADALANGAYAEAASLYDDLAADHPGNPAYARTAHILRARLDSPR